MYRFVENVRPFRLGLLITKKCNIVCRHCWFSSGTHRKEQMELGEALDYIDQATEIPSVQRISFSGGEPFTLPRLLEKLVSYASSHGFKTECVTNCFWGDSEERALKWLERLVDAGLEVLNISTDDFHQEHIPFNRVKNCFEAAKALGLKIVIMCCVSKSSKLGVEEVVKQLDDSDIRIIRKGTYPKLTKGASALAVETGFLPIGRAASLPRSELLTGQRDLRGGCSLLLRDISIAPSGRVLPCCSGGSLTDTIYIGNAKEHTLNEILDEASKRKVFRIISFKGLTELQRLLQMDSHQRYVNRCHLCYDVLTHSHLEEALSKVEV